MRALWTDERGSTVIEYGLICAMIFLAIVGSVELLSDKIVHTLYDKLAMMF